MKIYAGIGSRKTPADVLSTMQKLGSVFTRHGWILRSGNCQGADHAFQMGANRVAPAMVELFLPWVSYEKDSLVDGNVVHARSALAYELAARYHPTWKKCGPAARAFHARNVQIVLGAGLRHPV